MNFKSKPLTEIAAHVGGAIEGDATRVIGGVASLAAAGPGDLSFVANPRYARHLADTAAGAVRQDALLARMERFVRRVDTLEQELAALRKPT